MPLGWQQTKNHGKTWGPPVSSWESFRSLWTGGTHGTGCIPYRPGHSQNSFQEACGCVWKCRVPPNPMVNDHYPYEKWLFHWEYTIFSDKHNSRYSTLQWFLLRVPRSTQPLAPLLAQVSKQMWSVSENGGTGVPQKHPTNHPFSSINHFGKPPHQPFSSHLMRIFQYQPTNCPAVEDPPFLEPPRLGSYSSL